MFAASPRDVLLVRVGDGSAHYPGISGVMPGVEASADEPNEHSGRLCERIGMDFDGMRRHAQIAADGQLRNLRVYARTDN